MSPSRTFTGWQVSGNERVVEVAVRGAVGVVDRVVDRVVQGRDRCRPEIGLAMRDVLLYGWGMLVCLSPLVLAVLVKEWRDQRGRR